MQNKKYGEYGGQYVAESLMNVLKELESAYNEAINDPEFIKEYHYCLLYTSYLKRQIICHCIC